METVTGKLQQIQGIPIEKGYEGDILRNDANASAYPHDIISPDLLRKQLHMSLDINQPGQIELDEQNFFPAGHETNFEVEPTSKETKKRSRIETEMNEYEMGVDLKLDQLSLPGSNSWILLPSSSQGAYLSSTLDSYDNLGVDDTSKDELPSLIVMGCTRCYMYVMVSEADPKCPKCKSPMLLDKFRVNPTQKLRKN